ncbi:MAG: hypothetical protein ACI9JL_003585 [Paracoccaceae bacterium]
MRHNTYPHLSKVWAGQEAFAGRVFLVWGANIFNFTEFLSIPRIPVASANGVRNPFVPGWRAERVPCLNVAVTDWSDP